MELDSFDDTSQIQLCVIVEAILPTGSRSGRHRVAWDYRLAMR